jgi:hypothetical protein
MNEEIETRSGDPGELLATLIESTRWPLACVIAALTGKSVPTGGSIHLVIELTKRGRAKDGSFSLKAEPRIDTTDIPDDIIDKMMSFITNGPPDLDEDDDGKRH